MMKRKREAGLAMTGSAMSTIDETLASVADNAFAVAAEIAQRAVAHGVGMPLSRPDAFLGDMGRRQFRGDDLLGFGAGDLAIDDPLGAEIFRALDPERKFSKATAVGDHLFWQEVFGAEAEISVVVPDEIHRRRA